MQHPNATHKKYIQQFLGFMHTPNLLGNSMLLPYQNVELTPTTSSLIAFNENELSELEKQKYLGKRVELFFKKWLEMHPETELLTHGLQVVKNKITLGEFDFLYRHKDVYIHTELVYKQYIYLPNKAEKDIFHWVGPNKKDFLHIKLNKLTTHQFKLLQNETAAALIYAKFGIKASQFQQQICFKAQLFIHYLDKQITFYGIQPEAILGRWYYFKEFLLQGFEQNLFVLVEKQDWPILPHDSKSLPWMNFQETIKSISPQMKKRRSVKLWRKTTTSLHQLFVIWEEAEVT